MKNIQKAVLAGLIAISLTGTVSADTELIKGDITTSTTWTADNVYRLEDQIFVLPGATLTIEAGTVIASDTGVGGSLAVTRGAKIFVNGTEENPVIMTSTDDVATWTPDPNHPSGGDPKTGTWRDSANEWGNLTIMGKGLISASHFGGIPVGNNSKDPSGLNEKQMEGLTDPVNALYGGDDDNDDSGSISFLSLRYAGKVVGLGNELNGLSLGAIGRETDIHHVEIMNNVDDGIEIWGGTVNLKNISIWNVGDDSFDVDQGWRGKAQFIFIVQGYSVDGDQGSGIGDNAFETDGAEDSDAQPVTTTTIYNATVVGNPGDGDGGIVWRDNARVQYRNCIFMDLGEKLVRPDGDDGDGASGYGHNGTLSFEDTWNTDFTVTSTDNDCDGCSPGDFNHADTLYTVQTSGKLAEITDSVFFRNLNADAYTDSDAVGVTVGGGSNPAKNNVVIPGFDPADAPIVSITRGEVFTSTSEGKVVLPVVSIDPRAANDAVTSAGSAPDDGFFTPVSYRGAFSSNENWLKGWTAADAFGLTVTDAAPGGTPTPTATEPTPTPTETAEPTPTPTPGETGSLSELIVNPESMSKSFRPKVVAVTARDENGSPVAGATINADANGQRIRVSPTSAVTGSDGTAQFNISFGFLSNGGEVTFSSGQINSKVIQN